MAGNSSIATANCSAERRAVREEEEEEEEEEDKVWGCGWVPIFKCPVLEIAGYLSVSSTDLAVRNR